jgi:two-component system sensor kinase FixL
VSGMASALAHEINQPMTAARALARSAQHILRMPNADLARADGNLTTMIAQIDHVGAVVRHMRDFVRQGRPHVSTVDIRGVLENALMLVQADAAMKQIAIEPDAPGDLPLVYGDRIQLEQVVLNLVRNAIEAIAGTGRTDGRIRVFACRLDAPSRIEIGVADNGPGIEPALAGRLFQPLTTSKREGLGLGLPISASIVESHGGRIWLQTQAPGATEFRFSLPLEPSQAA